MKKYGLLFRVENNQNMYNIRIDHDSDSKCSPLNSNRGIGSSFRNFDRCTDWDKFESINGKFTARKSNHPIPPEIQRLQSKFGFIPGEPITKFNAGHLVPSMQGYHFEKYFGSHGNPNNAKAIPPGVNLKRNSSNLSSPRIKKPANVDVTSLRIGLKLSSPKDITSAAKFNGGSVPISRNGDITSLEIGLKVSRNGESSVGKKINVSITDDEGEGISAKWNAERDEDEGVRATWSAKRKRSIPCCRESFEDRKFVERQYDYKKI